MTAPLEVMKNQLRQTYLGKAGIHGVGINRALLGIRIYVEPQPGPDQSIVIDELLKAAAPFPVEIVREERPTAL